MILFTSDYTEGAHPRIIEKLAETNMEQTVGYGEDPYCEAAREAIKKVCDAPDADVHFLVGGTQTNFTVISSILRPFQGVICADSGHINVHETGAVEATGHKVLALPSKEGKIRYFITVRSRWNFSIPSSEISLQIKWNVLSAETMRCAR